MINAGKMLVKKHKIRNIGHKWTHGKVDKPSDKIINKTYTE